MTHFSLHLSGYASLFQQDSLTEDTDLISGMKLSVHDGGKKEGDKELRDNRRSMLHLSKALLPAVVK